MKLLFILNEPPYGNERVYNGLRLAGSVLKSEKEAEVTVFLMADAVLAAKGKILLCGTCMDARGLTEAEMMEGAKRSTMDELSAATVTADKVLVF